MAAIKNDDEQLKKENKKEMEEFNTKLAAIKNDNEQLKKEMEEINTKMKEFGSQINYLKNYIKQMEYDKEIIQYNNSRLYLTYISNPMKVIFLIQTKSGREDTIKRYSRLYDCFKHVSTFYKRIKERENDLCIKIIKYIGKDIKEEKEKEEWRTIKTEILQKFNDSVYYKGLVIFLFGEDYNNKLIIIYY